MELMPHDIVKFKNIDELAFDSPKPEWAFEALMGAPFAVVRRAQIIGEKVPIGIRGKIRNQRLAATIAHSNIVQRITPEELALSKEWRTNKHLQETGISQALEFVDNLLTKKGLKWGPTGSTGFELASGVSSVTEGSDLDIVIRAPQFISISDSHQLMDTLIQAPVKVDVQLETPKGSLALTEYARGGRLILLRTINGPQLVESPWI